jgi:hypothetical protein
MDEISRRRGEKRKGREEQERRGEEEKRCILDTRWICVHERRDHKFFPTI